MVNSNFILIFLQAQLIILTSCIVIPLPGGRSISYNSQTGVLRIQLESKLNPQNQVPSLPAAGTRPDQSVVESIEVRDTRISGKGFGAYATKPLKSDVFLGFYEGDLVRSRESLDEIVRRRQQARGAMDYIMSLDGGATFLDGYERAKDRTIFSPVHLNHADKNTPPCNCVRLLEENRVAFFTSCNISIGEEICFDYGSNFWSGREEYKL